MPAFISTFQAAGWQEGSHTFSSSLQSSVQLPLAAPAPVPSLYPSLSLTLRPRGHHSAPHMALLSLCLRPVYRPETHSFPLLPHASAWPTALSHWVLPSHERGQQGVHLCCVPLLGTLLTPCASPSQMWSFPSFLLEGAHSMVPRCLAQDWEHGRGSAVLSEGAPESAAGLRAPPGLPGVRRHGLSGTPFCGGGGGAAQRGGDLVASGGKDSLTGSSQPGGMVQTNACHRAALPFVPRDPWEPWNP